MNWDAIGALGEILGAAAVVGTLAYLAVQVRQSTERERLAQEIASNEYFHRLRELVASDAELADIEIRGVESLASLTDLERRRFDELLISWIWAFQKFYHQEKSSMMATTFEKGAPPIFERRFNGEGFLTWWSETRDEFSDTEFRSYMDELIASFALSRNTISP